MPEQYPFGLRDVLVNGFTLVDQDRVKENDVQIGPPRFERLSNSGPSFGTAAWNFTRDDFRVFEGWYHYYLLDGAKSFIMPVLVGAGLIDTELYFQTSYKATYMAKRVKVTAKLLVVEKPFDTRATVDQLIGDINTGPIAVDMGVAVTMTGQLSDALRVSLDVTVAMTADLS